MARAKKLLFLAAVLLVVSFLVVSNILRLKEEGNLDTMTTDSKNRYQIGASKSSQNRLDDVTNSSLGNSIISGADFEGELIHLSFVGRRLHFLCIRSNLCTSPNRISRAVPNNINLHRRLQQMLLTIIKSKMHHQ